MAKRLQLRRGTTAENNGFTGALGELTYDTEKKQLRVHDGSTVGGKVVNDLIPQATETALGVAKIATTSIAQAGVNDTDFITSKKLRDALNATGEAPVAPLRGFVVFTDAGAAPIIVKAINVVSVERVSTGYYKITTNTAVANAGILGFARSDSLASDRSISVNQNSSDSIVGNVVPIRVSWAGATQAQAFNSPFVCVGIF